ncbi:MAG: Fe-S-containing protein [Clostridiales Family XIII bacterium]|jgi:uncharacterized membrane protein|nr:Fe-S-containing protein [Clostridiales Family XIII bacterium]
MEKSNKGKKGSAHNAQPQRSRQAQRSLKKRRAIIGGVLGIAAGIAITVGVALSMSPEVSAGSYVDEATGDLVIEVAAVSEKASFHPITVDGTEMEVLALKASDGTIRTAFNTCQVCYTSGRGYYKQVGKVLICQNCGNSFELDQVGVEFGGCNPWEIPEDSKEATDSEIRILSSFLEESTEIFANWKTAE